ncbi:hypothetical protein LXL04_039186 [Taraxacum kok-saghyz]
MRKLNRSTLTRFGRTEGTRPSSLRHRRRQHEVSGRSGSHRLKPRKKVMIFVELTLSMEAERKGEEEEVEALPLRHHNALKTVQKTKPYKQNKTIDRPTSSSATSSSLLPLRRDLHTGVALSRPTSSFR